jgi:hypothetical protein
MTPRSTVPRAPGSETRAGEELRLVEVLDHLLDPLEGISPASRGRSSTDAGANGHPDVPIVRAGPRGTASTPPRTSSQPRPEFEVCRISYWRGYVKSQFQAITEREGEMLAIFSSPFFRAGSATPTRDDARAVAAHSALTEELSSFGWEITGCAANWYETTFRQRIAHRRVLRNV